MKTNKKTLKNSAIGALFSVFSSVVFSQVSINQSDISFNQFVSLSSKALGKVIVVSDDVEDNVNVFGDAVDTDFSQVFFSVLKANNLDYEETDNVIFIKPIDILPSYNQLITSVYRFNYIDSSVVFDAVESVLDSFEFDNDDVEVEFFATLFSDGSGVSVTAPASVQNHIRNLISQLDIEKKQVNIKAVILETTNTDIEQRGIDFAFDTGGFNFGVDNINENIVGNAGSIFSRFTSERLDLFARYLDTQDDVRILSQPNLTVVSGNNAQIAIGQNVPFVTGSITSDSVDSATPFQTIVREDIGLILDITPSVTPDGSVILQISQELSSISNDNIASDIITNQRTIQSTIRLKSNSSVVIGGLRSEDLIESKSGVPYISKVPVLGIPFKRRDKNYIERNFSLLISATIL